MAYIGRGLDKISNVEKLDNLTFDGSSTSYSLLKGGVSFTPSSANNILLSIDGVVQAGNFTVSGSTIDFGVAVSASSTCDFIIHYGVGVITTPSDNSVTAAKIPSGTISNSHLATTSINSQTAEATIADDDEVLIYDTSASALRKMTRTNFVSGVGGNNTPAFSAYSNSGQTLSDNIDTKIDFDTEDFDSDSAYDVSNKRFTVPSGKAGKYFFYTRIRFQKHSLSQYVIAIRVNGSEVAKRYIYSGNQTTGNFPEVQYFSYDISAVQTLAVGDYVEVYAKADHTGSDTTTLNSGSVQTEFSGYRLII